MTDYSISFPSAVPKTEGGLTIRADVEFGVMQANGDCVGVGICRIITTHQLHTNRSHRRRCPRARAFLSASEEGRLEMFFPKNGMLPCTERAFFRHRVFPVPLPVFLPEDIRTALPDLRQTLLDAGLYSVRVAVAGYWITF